MLNLLLMLNSELYLMCLVVYFLLKNLFLDEEYSGLLKMSDMNFWMILLIFILYLMMNSVEISFKFSLNMFFFILIYLMWVSNFLIFFIFYEMVFVLIMFVIILLGYSYERLMAGYLMMFYSFLFSSPMMMLFLTFDNIFLLKTWLNYSMMVNYFLVFSFMVKFPIFGFHYWLPVAHVEASTIGSMLLAGILLKLGSIGLFYVVIYLNFMVKFHWLSFSILMVMLLILFLSDLKMMIAYSSIAHMSLVFYILMWGSLIAKKGALMMMFYHGFLSPIMFWLVGLLSWWKTRSLMVVKFMTVSFLFFMMIFILSILNMSFPPFMGFLSEVYMLKTLINYSFILFILIMSVLFSCYYNIYFFWSFSNSMGYMFKINFYSMDIFIFLLMVVFLNF